MSKQTAYDKLRRLDDTSAIPIYICLEAWAISLTAAGGPLALAIGAEMVAETPFSSALLYSFIAALVLGASASLFGTLRKIKSFSSASADRTWALIATRISRQRRLVSDRSQQKIMLDPHGYSTTQSNTQWRIDAPDFCGGVFVSTVLSILGIVVILGAIFGTFASFIIAMTALTTKLTLGHVPTWALVNSIPLVFFVLPSIYQTGYLFPYQLLLCSAGGAVFAKLASNSGHHICELGIAAGAGAAFGLTLWLSNLPIAYLASSICCATPPRKVTEERVTRSNFWARQLFPPMHDDETEASLIQQERIRVIDNAFEAEGREKQLHPELHKVFWSRPSSLEKIAHYVLLINGHKYELRDVSQQHDRSDIQYRTAPASYEVPSRHAMFVTDAEFSERGKTFDLLLIGWTSLSHEQIDKICQDASEQWRYRPYLARGRSVGNCQHFVRLIAEQVVPKDLRASNWEWFRYDRMGPIQRAVDDAMQEARQREGTSQQPSGQLSAGFSRSRQHHQSKGGGFSATSQPSYAAGINWR